MLLLLYFGAILVYGVLLYAMINCIVLYQALTRSYLGTGHMFVEHLHLSIDVFSLLAFI